MAGSPDTSLRTEGQPREQLDGSVPKDTPTSTRAREDESYVTAMLRTRVKELEQQLKVVKGNCAIARLKEEREKFLLGEVTRASEILLCKQPRSPRVFSISFAFVIDPLKCPRRHSNRST